MEGFLLRALSLHELKPYKFPKGFGSLFRAPPSGAFCHTIIIAQNCFSAISNGDWNHHATTLTHAQPKKAIAVCVETYVQTAQSIQMTHINRHAQCYVFLQ